MTFRTAKCAAVLLGMSLSIAACGNSTREEAATWRADCPPPTRPEPLSLRTESVTLLRAWSISPSVVNRPTLNRIDA